MDKKKKSISKRFKATRTGKLSRRSTSLGHCRANKRTTELKRRKRGRSIDLPNKTIEKSILSQI